MTDFFGTIGLLLLHITFGVLFGLSWVELGYVLWIEERSNQRPSVSKPREGLFWAAGSARVEAFRRVRQSVRLVLVLPPP